MPFEDLKFEVERSTKTMASISYMRPARKGSKSGGKKLPRLAIAVPTVLTDQSSNKAGTRYGLQVGTGPDLGKARIVPSKKPDAVEPRDMKNCLLFRFGFIDRLGDEIADKEFVQARRLPDGSFEIDLPQWFK